jgi:hypothetical protein
MTTRAALLLFALPACAPDASDTLSGTWKGDVGGISVSVRVHTEYADASSTIVQGVISTNQPRCLRDAMMAGSLTNATVNLIAHGPGTLSMFTSVAISGELMDRKIVGLFSMHGDSDGGECKIEKQPIILTR